MAMGQKLSPADMELYRRVDEVLHYVWDPIGVAGNPMARDEYDGYLPHVFGILKENGGAEEIARYLGKVEVDRMGLKENVDGNKEVAQALLEWRKVISDRSGT
jgi:hypothetical protein